MPDPDGQSVTIELGGDDILIWIGANAESSVDPDTLALVAKAQEALQAGLSPDQLVEKIQRILVEPSQAMTVLDLCIRVAC